ncbi:MAG: M48 family metallopeptidase [Zoogloeaceae bacterium]|nr:M48 family metallopeptidase [Zoogloeaceae bacterium]
MPERFQVVLIVVLLSYIALRVVLLTRQARCVAAHRGAVPAAFSGHIPLAAHQRAADYTRAKILLEYAALAVETSYFLALTWGGGLQALHDFWSAHTTHPLVYGVSLIASVAVLSSLLDIPLNLYRQFRLEVRFGFNRMTPGLFFSDLLKQILLFVLLGLPFLAAALWLMRVMGEYWWFHVWLAWMAFNLLMFFVYPLWVSPLFNKFTPLPDGEVKARAEALLRRENFGKREFFVMDGSRRSSHGNAYFTGFGKAQRIVFFDTLLTRLTPPQIEAVLAHELGHFRHRHLIRRIALIFIVSLGFLALLGQLLFAPWFFQGLGVDAAQSGNAALALVLFSLVVPLFAILFNPAFHHFSRRDEFQADAYAARASSADNLIAALIRLYEDNAATLTPDPLYSCFYDSHPPAMTRIARLMTLAADNPAPAAA